MRKAIMVAAGAALVLPLSLAACSGSSGSSAADAAASAASGVASAVASAASGAATAAAGLTPGSPACQDLQSKVGALSSDGFNSGADIEQGDVDQALDELKKLSAAADGIVSGLGSQAPADAQQWLATTTEFTAKLEEATKSGAANQEQLQALIAQYNTPEYQQQSKEIAQQVEDICAG